MKSTTARRSARSKKKQESPPLIRALSALWQWEPERFAWRINPYVAGAIFLGLVIVHRAFLNGTALGGDDAFITYRFAYNNVHGHWFQWNVNEPPVYGTTTFLYTMLLTAAGFLGINIPIASLALSVLAQTAAAVFAFLIVRKTADDLAGLVAGALIAADGFGITATLGMETYLYIALVLGSLWCYQTGRFGWAGAGCALLGMTRVDGFVLAVILGGHYLMTWRKMPWKALAIFAVVLLPWFFTCAQFFGSLLPHTLGVKRLHSELGFSGLYSLLHVTDNMGWIPAILLLAAAIYGFWRSLHLRGAAMLLGVFVVLNAGSYYLAQLPNFTWYYAPTVAGTWVLAGFGIFYLTKRVRWAATVALCVLALFISIRIFISDPYGENARRSVHMQAAQWLRTHAAAGESVVAMEVGSIGFYNPGLTVYDLAGLESPTALHDIQERHFVERVARWDPNYIFLMDGMMYTWAIFHPILWNEKCKSWLSREDPHWLDTWNHWFENHYSLMKTWPVGTLWWDNSQQFYVLAKRDSTSS